ncbi:MULTISPECIES: hypothetical protein [unclassified Aureimonas]|uniref:hypothetical protein n=1 Tax=unclassified Aureimonas TaxID=2615206 RepID=UPI000720809D|nr:MULTISPECIES: hypothetical protein [unclassified Aureimonas]ALN72045.1 hypothetical protein M673_04910 [Aureimonas sp. AU20]
MYVVRIDCEDARKFQVFTKLRDARVFAREAGEGEGVEDAPVIFEVPGTEDAEIAVMAVRDGMGLPVIEPEPDAAVILASMGLGTGLRI